MITLLLRIRDDAPLGESALGRVGFHWDDEADDGEGRSNLVPLLIAAAGASADTLPIVVQGGSFTSALLAPGEPVGVWYDGPDGVSTAVGTIWADADGVLTGSIDTDGLAPGGYTLVAHGLWSEVVLSGSFTVDGGS